MTTNNRKSPVKQQSQQRIKHSNAIPVNNTNSGRMRSTSSMASSYPRMYNNHHHYHYQHYSNTTSPTAMSASSLPAVPLFYSNAYADPPECSSLPKPPDAWYLPLNVDNVPVKHEVDEDRAVENEKEKDAVPTTTVASKPKPLLSSTQQSKANFPRTCYYTNNNQGFYSPYYSSSTISGQTTSSYQRFPTQYISVKA